MYSVHIYVKFNWIYQRMYIENKNPFEQNYIFQ